MKFEVVNIIKKRAGFTLRQGKENVLKNANNRRAKKKTLKRRFLSCDVQNEEIVNDKTNVLKGRSIEATGIRLEDNNIIPTTESLLFMIEENVAAENIDYDKFKIEEDITFMHTDESV